MADGGGIISQTILAEGTAKGVRWGLRHCPSKIDESLFYDGCLLVLGQNSFPENTILPFTLDNYLRQYLAVTVMLQHHEISLLLFQSN